MWTLLSFGVVVVLFLYCIVFQPSPADRQWVLDNTCPVKQTRAVCNPTGIVWHHHSE